MFYGSFDNLLQTIDVGSECRKNQSSIYIRENIINTSTDNPFTHCKTGYFTIGTVCKQSKYAFFTYFSHFCQVCRLANWGEIKLKITCVDDVAWRCFYYNAI